jgi:hypothetical protein
MTKVIGIPGGLLTLNESNVKCPHCERLIPFEEIEIKWMNQEKHYIRIKCKCKRFISITSNIKGDFVLIS